MKTYIFFFSLYAFVENIRVRQLIHSSRQDMKTKNFESEKNFE